MSEDDLLIHVLPINDIVMHEESVECICGPRVEDGVVVHNSLDGREQDELDVYYDFDDNQ